MWADLRERMAQFGLRLHEEKTRLIEFGRLPALDQKRGSQRRLSWEGVSQMAELRDYPPGGFSYLLQDCGPSSGRT